MAKSRLTKSQVKHIARLARLELTDKEVEEFRKQLADILDYVSQLNELDASGIEPTSQVTGLENVTREDKPTPSLNQKEVLSNAPRKQNNFFKIKAIFE